MILIAAEALRLKSEIMMWPPMVLTSRLVRTGSDGWSGRAWVVYANVLVRVLCLICSCSDLVLRLFVKVLRFTLPLI